MSPFLFSNPGATVNKQWGIPIGVQNYLRFDVWNRTAGAPLTGALTGDFTTRLTIGLSIVSPNGLYVHEIGEGGYHVSLSSDPSVGFISTEEQQVKIDVTHNTHGPWRTFDFWAYRLEGRIEDLLAELFETREVLHSMATSIYGTVSEIQDRLTVIRAALTRAYKAQATGTAAGNSLTHQDIQKLADEEKRLMSYLGKLDNSGKGGDQMRVQFTEPL